LLVVSPFSCDPGGIIETSVAVEGWLLTLLLLLVSDIVTLKLRNYNKIIAERIKNKGYGST
jgi:hypothetical protein